MGTIDWAECAFCEYWVFDPYLYDPGGYALCDWCDDYLEWGGAPNAPDHWWSRLQSTTTTLVNLRLFPQLQSREVVQIIVTFLIETEVEA